jgi:hypothetical protein
VRESGYGIRWVIESLFAAFKGWFGEYMSSIRPDNIRKELIFKLKILVGLFAFAG